MATTTNIISSPASPNQYKGLVILPNCNAQARCASWLGALNNQTTRGCGVNVLRFMGEIDEVNANRALNRAMSGQGTPFEDVVQWFNHKIQSSPVPRQGDIISKHDFLIDTRQNLTDFFNFLTNMMIPNSCTIVKYNRDPVIARNLNRTPGHYVLISKHSDGSIWTYEPYSSRPNFCDRRKYPGVVSQNFIGAFNREGYINASVLVYNVAAQNVAQQPDPPGSGPMEISGGGNHAFLMPEDTVADLIKDIERSTECDINVSGGKTIKKRRVNKKKINKNTTHKQKKYKKRKQTKHKKRK